MKTLPSWSFFKFIPTSIDYTSNCLPYTCQHWWWYSQWVFKLCFYLPDFVISVSNHFIILADFSVHVDFHPTSAASPHDHSEHQTNMKLQSITAYPLQIASFTIPIISVLWPCKDLQAIKICFPMYQFPLTYTCHTMKIN